MRRGQVSFSSASVAGSCAVSRWSNGQRTAGRINSLRTYAELERWRTRGVHARESPDHRADGKHQKTRLLPQRGGVFPGALPLRLARVLLEIAEDPKAHNRDRVAAIRELLDRGWGKAPAFAAMEAGDPLELGEIAREIQGIADELAARREAKP